MNFRPLLAVALAWASPAQAVEYKATALSDDKSELIIVTTRGSKLKAPLFEDQDEFEAPNVSPNGRYVGWLASYPGRGASYSQPLYVIVMDRARRTHQFSGSVGMVNRWCFWPRRNAVVYASSFPHGPTPTWFEMRRIDDERLLGRYEIPEASPRTNKDLRAAPQWIRCIPDWDER